VSLLLPPPLPPLTGAWPPQVLPQLESEAPLESKPPPALPQLELDTSPPAARSLLLAPQLHEEELLEPVPAYSVVRPSQPSLLAPVRAPPPPPATRTASPSSSMTKEPPPPPLEQPSSTPDWPTSTVISSPAVSSYSPMMTAPQPPLVLTLEPSAPPASMRQVPVLGTNQVWMPASTTTEESRSVPE